MTSHERAEHTLRLHDFAHDLDLRNRAIHPEGGWRIVDIMGAPSRAYTEATKVTVFREAALEAFYAWAASCRCYEVGRWCPIHDK